MFSVLNYVCEFKFTFLFDDEFYDVLNFDIYIDAGGKQLNKYMIIKIVVKNIIDKSM